MQRTPEEQLTAPREAHGWKQSRLEPPAVTEIVLRLGVMPYDDHVQAMVESRSKSDGELLAMWSVPHVPTSQAQRGARDAIAKLLEYLDDALEAFPDLNDGSSKVGS